MEISVFTLLKYTIISILLILLILFTFLNTQVFRHLLSHESEIYLYKTKSDDRGTRIVDYCIALCSTYCHCSGIMQSFYFNVVYTYLFLLVVTLRNTYLAQGKVMFTVLSVNLFSKESLFQETDSQVEKTPPPHREL